MEFDSSLIELIQAALKKFSEDVRDESPINKAERKPNQIRPNVKRSVKVIDMTSIGQAQEVTNILQENDIAIVKLHIEEEKEQERVLNFLFGMAFALHIQPECVSDNVFAFDKEHVYKPVNVESASNE